MGFLGYVADAPLVRHRVVQHRLAIERQRSGARVDQAHYGVHRRALAGSVRTQVAEDLPAPDLEVDAIEGEEPSVAFGQSTSLEHSVTRSFARNHGSI
jgi:hypothetical protein